MVDLKAFRKSNKISQVELADYLGIGQAFISQMENGSRPVPNYILDKLLANIQGWDTSMLQSSQGGIAIQQTGNKNRVGNVTSLSDGGEVAALYKEIEMLLQRIEEQKAENERLWKMIDKLTEK